MNTNDNDVLKLLVVVGPSGVGKVSYTHLTILY
jgi:guanylate kinase